MEGCVYSIVKTTRFYAYQTWPSICLRNPPGAQRFVGIFFLGCAFRMLIGWANKLLSHGWYDSVGD